ncbi:hypothetical protein P154DRAFT_455248 [Amniculicola lignicola CBS 123094]|uniref:Zn(2)-C6 fungal-type domain-containing protein n=1 Tax=Amniculicola lignicola CBS 123094 TaxID=1392246 RepID=A0A6A5WXP6_9PLEO|nr:hypothetical protein P154DRAFT_455248 [Amniculicola lignicola CBS 123094]
MMPKRSWSQANPQHATPSNHGLHASTTSITRRGLPEPSSDSVGPSISRKVKACASCRKQKIKCIMEDSGPPCKRCEERNLSCVLNKSLQSLIEERSQWRTTVTGDVEHMHSALQEVLERLSLPPLPALQTSSSNTLSPSPHEALPDREDQGPSYDTSPQASPRDDALPDVPIESLYQITRLRALRSDDTAEESRPSPTGPPNHPVHDFISNGAISIEDAERLVNMYLSRIDHFMYSVGGSKYHNLESLRRGSAILTACICTVAALHDPMSNNLYGICSREFRRLMAASMFDTRIDRDHLRAMCIGSYWLHDISWTLSGYAIRRATEVNLSSNHARVLTTNSEEAMDCMRIWYLLYICDHHSSILYGRPAIVREDTSISRWEELATSSIFTESDKRLCSQMALLIIMSNVRDLFGDTKEPIPRAFGRHLTNFSRQIDQWMGYWSTELLKLHPQLGEFPTKGVILHHYLAKLHLHSHVFRGLHGAPVPAYFHTSATSAVSAATSTLEMLLTDPDVRTGLVGIPHYIHSMIAFACVFLLKVTTQHPGRYIEDTQVLDMTTKVVGQFRSTAVGKFHLVHLMADGLEKMAASKIRSPGTRVDVGMANGNGIGSGTGTGTGAAQSEMQYLGELGGMLPPVSNGNASGSGNGNGIYGTAMVGNGFEEELIMSTTPFLHFDSGDFDFSFTGFGL